MYRDNSLMPSEAVRLLALGLLADNPLHYEKLASEIRHFTGRMVGPSLELVAQPLELLRLEGLIKPIDGQGMQDNALLDISDSGHDELEKLMTSNIRPLVNDLNKLIVALKMRFLHHLPKQKQLSQVELLIEIFERELTRLTDLRSHQAEARGELTSWLDFEISQTQRRMAWFEDLQTRLTA